MREKAKEGYWRKRERQKQSVTYITSITSRVKEEKIGRDSDCFILKKKKRSLMGDEAP